MNTFRISERTCVLHLSGVHCEWLVIQGNPVHKIFLISLKNLLSKAVTEETIKIQFLLKDIPNKYIKMYSNQICICSLLLTWWWNPLAILQYHSSLVDTEINVPITCYFFISWHFPQPVYCKEKLSWILLFIFLANNSLPWIYI